MDRDAAISAHPQRCLVSPPKDRVADTRKGWNPLSIHLSTNERAVQGRCGQVLSADRTAFPTGKGVRSFLYMRIHSSPAVSLVVAITIPIKEPLPWTSVRPIL